MSVQRKACVKSISRPVHKNVTETDNGEQALCWPTYAGDIQQNKKKLKKRKIKIRRILCCVVFQYPADLTQLVNGYVCWSKTFQYCSAELISWYAFVKPFVSIGATVSRSLWWSTVMSSGSSRNVHTKFAK